MPTLQGELLLNNDGSNEANAFAIYIFQREKKIK